MKKRSEHEEASGGMDVGMVAAKAQGPPRRTEPQARDSCTI